MTSTSTGEYSTEKRGHITVTRAGFEPTILVFEQSKSEAPWTVWPF